MSQIARGMIGGLIGMVLVLAGWHLWIDHQQWHQLLMMVQQQAAKAAPEAK